MDVSRFFICKSPRVGGSVLQFGPLIRFLIGAFSEPFSRLLREINHTEREAPSLCQFHACSDGILLNIANVFHPDVIA